MYATTVQTEKTMVKDKFVLLHSTTVGNGELTCTESSCVEI